jgi:hypothetical protein
MTRNSFLAVMWVLFFCRLSRGLKVAYEAGVDEQNWFLKNQAGMRPKVREFERPMGQFQSSRCVHSRPAAGADRASRERHSAGSCGCTL